MTRSLLTPRLPRRCASAALLGGCKPKAGASCKIETKEVCVDAKQALVCHDGKWEEMTCRGPSGCAKTGSESSCDQTVAEDKDVCNLVNDFVCSGDKKGMLECTKNRWTFVAELPRRAQLRDGGEEGHLRQQPRQPRRRLPRRGRLRLLARQEERPRLPEREVRRRQQLQGQERAAASPATRTRASRSSATTRSRTSATLATRKATSRARRTRSRSSSASARSSSATTSARSNEKCAVKGELVGCY